MLLTKENIKNFAPSCPRNQEYIGEQFDKLFKNQTSLLEIGSYSAQHALHLCESRLHIQWQPTDQKQYLEPIKTNLKHHPRVNICAPIELNVENKEHWPNTKYDAVYTANTLHIMSLKHVELFFESVAQCIKLGGKLCVYGPFKYQGNFTSESNEAFNQWLKNKDELSAIRDFEYINSLAQKQGLTFLADTKMPANNQFIVWQKTI